MLNQATAVQWKYFFPLLLGLLSQSWEEKEKELRDIKDLHFYILNSFFFTDTFNIPLTYYIYNGIYNIIFFAYLSDILIADFFSSGQCYKLSFFLEGMNRLMHSNQVMYYLYYSIMAEEYLYFNAYIYSKFPTVSKHCRGCETAVSVSLEEVR